MVLNEKDKSKQVNKVVVVDDIQTFGYVLHDTDTALYKEVFAELKKVLAEEETDYNKYAEYIGKLFVISFYNLDNKVTNHDIGGLEFFHPEYIEVFRTKAKDGMYKYIKSNVYDDRKQELPIVSNVELISVENESFEYNELKDDNAYVVKLKVSYERDLGYSKEVSLTLVRVEHLLYVVEVKS